MSVDWYSRTELLIGKNNLQKLKNAKIVVLGLGGVGGSCAEALCRSGVGNLMIIDNDDIDITNINRQIIATHENIGECKINVMKKRLKSINNKINIEAYKTFCLPQNSDFIFNYQPDYIVDAIDTITTKIFFAKKTHNLNINFISCMGMGNRLDNTLIRCGKLSDTIGCGCAVAKIIRKKLKEFGILELDVVYSLEKPSKVVVQDFNSNGRHAPGSFACVPPVAGYFLASKVINDIIY